MNKPLFDAVYDYLKDCECVVYIQYVFSEIDYVMVRFIGYDESVVVRYPTDIAKLKQYM